MQIPPERGLESCTLVWTHLKTFLTPHLCGSLTTPPLCPLIFLTSIAASVHAFAFSALQSTLHTGAAGIFHST